MQNENRTIGVSEQSDERFERLVDAAPDAVVVMDGDGLITAWNRRAETMFGWSQAEAIGRDMCGLIIPARLRSEHEEGMQRFLSAGERAEANSRIEITALRRDGQEFLAELAICPLQLEDGWAFGAFVRDITARKYNEQVQAATFLCSEAAHSTHNLDELFDVVCPAIGNLLSAKSFHLALRDSATGLLSHCYTRDFEETSASLTAQGKRYMERVSETGTPERAGRNGLALEGEEEDWLCVPLRSTEGTLGVIGVRNGATGVHYGEEQERVLVFVSTQIAMAVERKKAQQHLQLSHEQLERRVQERTGELSKAKETAEAATRAKSQFLANMSHEIRTPLNGVIGMTSLLLAHDLGPEELEFAETIKLSGEALLTVVNDILDFSKIEAGKFHLDAIEFSPRTVLEEAIEVIAVNAHRKVLELTLEVDPGFPAHVSGDPARLRQTILNLLSNAVKFTDQGEIRLRARQQAREGNEVELYIEVNDSGIGVAPEVQERLFESFMQADSSTTRRYGGTGLGLAISKQLVQRMGGRIGVRSKPGQGSSFWFTIRAPLLSKPAVSTEQPQDMQTSRVLVVDDNETNRRILKAQLGQWRIQTETADDGPSALRALLSAYQAGRPFDLVILDLMMPVMDGLMLTEAIRSQAMLANMPIILLTSAAVPAVISRAKELRVTACLTKPAREAHLLRTVARALVGEGDGIAAGLDRRPGASGLSALHRNLESKSEVSKT